MKEGTMFGLVVGSVVLSLLLLWMGVPDAATGQTVTAGLFRCLFVFGTINAILLFGCFAGYWRHRERIVQILKYPKVALGMLLIDGLALLVVLAAFVKGAGVWGSQYGWVYAIFGALVMFFNLPLLALYRDSLKVDAVSTASQPEEAG